MADTKDTEKTLPSPRNAYVKRNVEQGVVRQSFKPWPLQIGGGGTVKRAASLPAATRRLQPSRQTRSARAARRKPKAATPAPKPAVAPEPPAGPKPSGVGCASLSEEKERPGKASIAPRERKRGAENARYAHAAPPRRAWDRPTATRPRPAKRR